MRFGAAYAVEAFPRHREDRPQAPGKQFSSTDVPDPKIQKDLREFCSVPTVSGQGMKVHLCDPDDCQGHRRYLFGYKLANWLPPTIPGKARAIGAEAPGIPRVVGPLTAS